MMINISKADIVAWSMVVLLAAALAGVLVYEHRLRVREYDEIEAVDIRDVYMTHDETMKLMDYIVDVVERVDAKVDSSMSMMTSEADEARYIYNAIMIETGNREAAINKTTEYLVQSIMSRTRVIPSDDSTGVYIAKLRDAIEKAKRDTTRVVEVTVHRTVQQASSSTSASIVKRDYGFTLSPMIGAGYSGTPRERSLSFDPYVGIKFAKIGKYGLHTGATLECIGGGASVNVANIIPLVKNTNVIGMYGRGYHGGEVIYIGLGVEL